MTEETIKSINLLIEEKQGEIDGNARYIGLHKLKEEAYKRQLKEQEEYRENLEKENCELGKTITDLKCLLNNN